MDEKNLSILNTEDLEEFFSFFDKTENEFTQNQSSHSKKQFSPSSHADENIFSPVPPQWACANVSPVSLAETSTTASGALPKLVNVYPAPNTASYSPTPVYSSASLAQTNCFTPLLTPAATPSVSYPIFKPAISTTPVFTVPATNASSSVGRKQPAPKKYVRKRNADAAGLAENEVT